jgi:hypothetical protein
MAMELLRKKKTISLGKLAIDDSEYTRDDRFNIKSGGIAITVGGVGAGF